MRKSICVLTTLSLTGLTGCDSASSRGNEAFKILEESTKNLVRLRSELDQELLKTTTGQRVYGIMRESGDPHFTNFDKEYSQLKRLFKEYKGGDYFLEYAIAKHCSVIHYNQRYEKELQTRITEIIPNSSDDLEMKLIRTTFANYELRWTRAGLDSSKKELERLISIENSINCKHYSSNDRTHFSQQDILAMKAYREAFMATTFFDGAVRTHKSIMDALDYKEYGRKTISQFLYEEAVENLRFIAGLSNGPDKQVWRDAVAKLSNLSHAG